jgi:hypothetical protein
MLSRRSAPGGFGAYRFVLGLFGDKFPDFGGFTDLVPDIVELGPPYPAGTYQFNLGNPGGMEGKYPFNPDAVGVFPHHKGLAYPGIFYGDYKSFINLDPFILAFHNLEVDFYRIPHLEAAGVFLHL